MADSALDALAPGGSGSQPAPAATPAPSPTPQAQPAAASPAPTAAAQPAQPAGPSEMQQFLTSLGVKDPRELREAIDLTRQLRAEHLRQQQLQRQNDPRAREVAERGQAFRQLHRETYGTDYDPRTQEDVAQYMREQRAEAGVRDMTDTLGDIGITFDGSQASAELRAGWEEVLHDRLMSDRRLNAMYHGSPADRREAVSEIIKTHERLMNDLSMRQSGMKLRDWAAKQRNLPRVGRTTGGMPGTAPAKSTNPNPVARRREDRTAMRAQLADIHAHYVG